MVLALDDFAAGDIDYVAKLNNNNAALESEVNNLSAQVAGTIGPGGPLILDVFDRDGIVGAHSYRLDLDQYPGGTVIKIGRRPTFNPVFGEVDVSVGWGTFAGTKARVEQVGDVDLDAASIVAGLPKTIFVGVGSSGTAQLFEDSVTPNVLYVYSMTWNGFSLSDFKRLAPILPGYELHKALLAPKLIQIHDGETDWVSDTIGKTEIVLPGHSDDNEIDVEGSMEVLGFFVSSHEVSDDGFNAPGGNPPTDSIVRLDVKSDAVKWNLTDIELDMGTTPDTVYVKVDEAAVGDDRFVVEVKRFHLERTLLGDFVTSARNFTWGIIVRPLIGTPVPRDIAFTGTI